MVRTHPPLWEYLLYFGLPLLVAGLGIYLIRRGWGCRDPVRWGCGITVLVAGLGTLGGALLLIGMGSGMSQRGSMIEPQELVCRKAVADLLGTKTGYDSELRCYTTRMGNTLWAFKDQNRIRLDPAHSVVNVTCQPGINFNMPQIHGFDYPELLDGVKIIRRECVYAFQCIWRGEQLTADIVSINVIDPTPTKQNINLCTSK